MQKSTWFWFGIAACAFVTTGCGGGSSGTAGTPADPDEESSKAVTSSLLTAQMARKFGSQFAPSGGSKQETQACPQGGTVHSTFAQRAVGSPYSDDDFDVTGSSYQDCAVQVEQQFVTLNGSLEFGTPSSGEEPILYFGFGDRFGQSGELFRARVVAELANQGAVQQTDFVVNGFLDFLGTGGETGADFELQQFLDLGLAGRIDHADSSVDEFSVGLALGDNTEPFVLGVRLIGNSVHFDIDGSYSYANAALPADCVGVTNVRTLEAVRVVGDSVVGGRLVVTDVLTGADAEVTFLADGGSTVRIDGVEVEFSDDDVSALEDACSDPRGIDPIGLAIEFPVSFIQGFASAAQR